VRPYWELALIGFRRTAAYRAAAVSGSITNTFFGFLRAAVFAALYEGSGRAEVGGYTLADALLFAFATQGVIALVELWAWWKIAETVHSGQIATDLSRPIDYQLGWLAQDYGRALFQLVGRTLPPFVVGVAAFELAVPAAPVGWLALAPSLVLAVAVSFGWRFCLNLTAFWLGDYRGVASLANLVVLLLSGFLVPVAMFPDAIRAAAYVLPFASMIAIPLDVFLGKLTGAELLAALALQAFWAVAMLLLGRAMLAAALHKLVIQGG
jgi:ABC-2 type transport system permease protein